MKLLSVLCWRWFASRRRPVRHALSCGTPIDGVLQEEIVEPVGCGWFDSSWALHAGLQITEHETTDRVVNDLPLAWWLAWQPAPQRGAAAPAR
jgi:hypothetical protein